MRLVRANVWAAYHVPSQCQYAKADHQPEIWSNILDGLDEVAQACANGSLPEGTAEYNLWVEPFKASFRTPTYIFKYNRHCSAGAAGGAVLQSDLRRWTNSSLARCWRASWLRHRNIRRSNRTLESFERRDDQSVHDNSQQGRELSLSHRCNQGHSLTGRLDRKSRRRARTYR